MVRGRNGQASWQDRLELDEARVRAAGACARCWRGKERRAQGRFLVEGRQAVREARCAVTPWSLGWSVRWDSARDNRDLIDLVVRAGGVPVHGVSEQNLATMSDTVTPQGVIAVADSIDVSLEQALSGAPRLVVVCDQIRDPGNAGTVIRCADAFGADAVVMSTDSVDLHNPKVVRASVGSIFHLPIVVGVEFLWCAASVP